MHSRRELEGYLLIDHRDSPGITPEQAAHAGNGTISVPAGKKLECATYNCSHCTRLVIMRPDRTRARGYCPKCDRVICDGCEVIRVASGGACKPFKQIVDEFVDKAAKTLICI